MVGSRDIFHGLARALFKASAHAPWGADVFEGQSDNGMSAFDWRMLEDEELIFFSPGLIEPNSDAQRRDRISIRLESAICARLHWIVSTLAQAHSQARDDLLRDIAKSDAIGNRDPFEALRIANEEQADWYGPAQFQSPARRVAFLNSSPAKSDMSDWAAVKSYALGTLALLRDAATFNAAHDGNRRATWTNRPSLAEFGLLAIHSSINPAYILAELEPIQEALSLACWAGILMRGRPAIVPAQMRPILKAFGGFPNATENGSPASLLDHVIRYHLSLALGPRGMQRLFSTDVPAVIVPRRSEAISLLSAEAAVRQQQQMGTAPEYARQAS